MNRWYMPSTDEEIWFTFMGVIPRWHVWRIEEINIDSGTVGGSFYGHSTWGCLRTTNKDLKDGLPIGVLNSLYKDKSVTHMLHNLGKSGMLYIFNGNDSAHFWNISKKTFELYSPIIDRKAK